MPNADRYYSPLAVGAYILTGYWYSAASLVYYKRTQKQKRRSFAFADLPVAVPQ